MCQQQQQQTTKVAPTTTTTEEEHDGFMSCGLDRSCPKSVTTPQGQGVRLDQYQSSITGNKNDRRRRRQSCTGATSITTATSPSTSIDTDTAATSTCASVISDHDFEWYDLDAIREAHNSNSNNNNNNNNNDRAIIIGHDFHAGLVFTTERQVLGKGAEANIVNSFTRSGFNNRNTQKKDLFFWVNNDHNNRVEETPLEKEEREFRERMEELEQEINNCYNDNNYSS